MSSTELLTTNGSTEIFKKLRSSVTERTEKGRPTWEPDKQMLGRCGQTCIVGTGRKHSPHGLRPWQHLAP